MNQSFAIIGFIFFCQGSSAIAAVEETSKVNVGDEAPNFRCQTLSDDIFSLSDQKGKVVLINFFATWCGPCLAELPLLQERIFRQYKDRADFGLIAIGIEHLDPELKVFAIAHELSLPMASDPNLGIYGKYGESGIPKTFLIGKDGMIKYASTGFSESSFQLLEEAIQTELSKDFDALAYFVEEYGTLRRLHHVRSGPMDETGEDFELWVRRGRPSFADIVEARQRVGDELVRNGFFQRREISLATAPSDKEELEQLQRVLNGGAFTNSWRNYRIYPDEKFVRVTACPGDMKVYEQLIRDFEKSSPATSINSPLDRE